MGKFFWLEEWSTLYRSLILRMTKRQVTRFKFSTKRIRSWWDGTIHQKKFNQEVFSSGYAECMKPVRWPPSPWPDLSLSKRQPSGKKSTTRNHFWWNIWIQSSKVRLNSVLTWVTLRPARSVRECGNVTWVSKRVVTKFNLMCVLGGKHGCLDQWSGNKNYSGWRRVGGTPLLWEIYIQWRWLQVIIPLLRWRFFQLTFVCQENNDMSRPREWNVGLFHPPKSDLRFVQSRVCTDSSPQGSRWHWSFEIVVLQSI